MSSDSAIKKGWYLHDNPDATKDDVMVAFENKCPLPKWCGYVKKLDGDNPYKKKKWYQPGLYAFFDPDGKFRACSPSKLTLIANVQYDDGIVFSIH